MTSLLRLLYVAAGALCASIVVLRAAPPPELPVATFFQKASLTQLTFSPDGNRIACLVPYERRMNLAVIDLEKRTKNLLTNFKDNDVGSLLWANNTRLIYTKDFDGQEWPAVFAVNVDGSDRILLASGAEQRDTTLESNQQFRGLLARLPRDPKNFLVLGNLSGAQGPDVCRMDLRTGRMQLEVSNPGWVRRWVLDRERNVRLGVEQKRQTITITLRNAKGGWDVLHTRQADEPGWTPIAFDGDNRTLFVASNLGRKTSAVYRYDTHTRTMGELVFGHEAYDVDNVLYDEAKQKVVGVSYQADRERFHWIDAAAEALQARLDAALRDTVNVQRHAAPDGSKRLIFASSDRDPGVYYLFNHAANKLEELAVVKPAIDPEKMAPMQHLTFAARDGLTIHAYLTLPLGRDAKMLPLVIHPHGGPFGIRDRWGFNPEVQFYANRGYAVLQVNYRGSGGYGEWFERKGWKKWGLEMQDDLSDAVQWAVAKGIADPQRVVIAGASYGGYATLAGLAFTPDLYCAGVNYVGVSDIAELIPRGDGVPAERAHWYATRIGDLANAEDRKRIRDTSPLHAAEKIRAPLLMAYGKNDPRVRLSQGVDLEAALRKAGKTFEMIVEKEEGHGFRKEELSIAFFTRVDEFLKKHVQKAGVKIGPTKVIDAPAKSGD